MKLETYDVLTSTRRTEYQLTSDEGLCRELCLVGSP